MRLNNVGAYMPEKGHAHYLVGRRQEIEIEQKEDNRHISYGKGLIERC